MEHIWLRESIAEYDSVNNKHDKGYKYLLSARKIFVELLRSFVRQGWVEQIDENNAFRVDKSFILQDFKDKESDLVYWVKLNNQDVIFYILLEMQSTVDFQMPYRLLLYMVEVWRGFLKDSDENRQKRKEFRLPAVVPIVLYNGVGNWSACRSYKEYLSGYEMFGNNIVDFTYILIDVNRYTEEELLELSNLISAVFLIDQKKSIESLLERVKKAVNIIGGLNPQEFDLFKNWFVNIIVKANDCNDSEDNKDYELIRKAFSDSKESENMVYNFAVALEEAMLESKKKGIIEEKKKIAKYLFKMGLPLEKIAEVTELSLEEAMKLDLFS